MGAGADAVRKEWAGDGIGGCVAREGKWAVESVCSVQRVSCEGVAQGAGLRVAL